MRGYWPAEGRLIQSGILKHTLDSHGSRLEMTDRGSKGKSGGELEGSGTHCWLHPAYLSKTGGLDIPDEDQGQI